jgi:phage head maturation protease
MRLVRRTAIDFSSREGTVVTQPAYLQSHIQQAHTTYTPIELDILALDHLPH